MFANCRPHLVELDFFDAVVNDWLQALVSIVEGLDKSVSMYSLAHIFSNLIYTIILNQLSS